MSKQALQRIMRLDMKDNERFDLHTMGIHLVFDEENIMKAKALLIGPPGTPYHLGMLFFTIEFPRDYPFSPPLVQYVSSSRVRIHPNLYVGRSDSHYQGKVCLSSLNTWTGPKWTSIMTIGSILITIQSLLDAHPLRNEPGYEKVAGAVEQTYNRIIEYDTLKQLVYRHGAHVVDPAQSIYPGFEGFTDIIRSHLRLSKATLRDSITRLQQTFPKEMVYLVGIYRLRVHISYPQLAEEMDSFLNLI
mgnify:CR=1 FL=1